MYPQTLFAGVHKIENNPDLKVISKSLKTVKDDPKITFYLIKSAHKKWKVKYLEKGSHALYSQG